MTVNHARKRRPMWLCIFHSPRALVQRTCMPTCPCVYRRGGCRERRMPGPGPLISLPNVWCSWTLDACTPPLPSACSSWWACRSASRQGKCWLGDVGPWARPGMVGLVSALGREDNSRAIRGPLWGSQGHGVLWCPRRGRARSGGVVLTVLDGGDCVCGGGWGAQRSPVLARRFEGRVRGKT